ncbi:hypothetical protein DM860_015957 [Cuscuta australis]|uniref:BHLH domain-containing protein n=1 Tax=Cuscuta australis TaxID=267555 RepID=A0A328E029_9ASTE|nr:hypothetical protein DM860_015957 [Cuscuta australis]
MENIGEEYEHYWETHTFLQSEELDRYLEEAIPAAAAAAYYDSSSPDGSAASKNIVSERNRRKKLNERLFALRAVVPKITKVRRIESRSVSLPNHQSIDFEFCVFEFLIRFEKMDKASIIKDAIEYIQELREQERAIQAEIWDLESSSICRNNANGNNNNNNYNGVFEFEFEFDEDAAGMSCSNSKAAKRSKVGEEGEDEERAWVHRHRHRPNDSSSSSPDNPPPSPPLHVLELRVSSMGKKTLVVSLTCSKTRDSMVKLCEIFESLDIKIISANITAFSATLLNTLFIEAEEEEKDLLKIRIESAIATLNDPDSPMGI